MMEHTFSYPNFKVDIFSEVLSIWAEHGYDYTIAHGMEDYPDQVGRDIDILAEPKHQSLMIQTVVNLANSDDSLSFYIPNEFFGKRIIVYRKKNPYEALEVHLISQIRWMGFDILPTQIDQQHKQGYVYSYMVQYAKRAVLPSLAGNLKKLESKPTEFLINSAELPFVKDFLSKLLYEEKIREIEAYNDKGESVAIFEVIQSCRADIIKLFFKKNVFVASKSIFTALLRKFTVYLYPNSPVILAERSVAEDISQFRPKSIFLRVVQRKVGGVNPFVVGAKITFNKVRYFFDDRRVRACQGIVVYSLDEGAKFSKLLEKWMFDRVGTFTDFQDFEREIMDVSRDNYNS